MSFKYTDNIMKGITVNNYSEVIDNLFALNSIYLDFDKKEFDPENIIRDKNYLFKPTDVYDKFGNFNHFKADADKIVKITHQIFDSYINGETLIEIKKFKIEQTILELDTMIQQHDILNRYYFHDYIYKLNINHNKKVFKIDINQIELSDEMIALIEAWYSIRKDFFNVLRTIILKRQNMLKLIEMESKKIILDNVKEDNSSKLSFIIMEFLIGLAYTDIIDRNPFIIDELDKSLRSIFGVTTKKTIDRRRRDIMQRSVNNNAKNLDQLSLAINKEAEKERKHKASLKKNSSKKSRRN